MHCLPQRPQCCRLNCMSTHLPSQHVMQLRPLASAGAAAPSGVAASGTQRCVNGTCVD